MPVAAVVQPRGAKGEEDEMGRDYLDLLELNAERGGLGLGNWGERVRSGQEWSVATVLALEVTLQI